MKICFFGTPDLAAQILQDLLTEPDIEIVSVVTNPDRPFGRDQMMRQSAVKSVAITHEIPVLTPTKIRWNAEFLETLSRLNAEYFVVVAYGRILPRELLDLPRSMCINVHGSILPKYRGASPIQSALLHGETETGVTIMQMSEGMDEGNILQIRQIPIAPGETAATLFEKFAQVSGPVLIDTLRQLESGTIVPVPQDASQASYCKKIEKEDGLVKWSESAETIYHQWQAYTPWPGIYTIYTGKRLLLEKISISPYDGDDAYWSVIQLETGSIGVVCGMWVLILEQVKLEWKKSQSIRDFVNGNRDFIFSKL